MLIGRMHPVGPLLLALAAGLLARPAEAQVMPDGPTLTAADLRSAQDLSGDWTWSIDPYRDGQAG
ncbi:MAG: hypothetical protein KJ872_03850, partial [Alphaproteobacteria bacterium]|nr:hypothetical protein [Alphaproteobacteria bacterium]